MSRLDFLKVRPWTRHRDCKRKEKLRYKCQVCNKYCKTECCLKLHMQCHKKHKSGLYRCCVCHFTYSQKHVLQSHLRQVHFKERQKKFCDKYNTVSQCMCCLERFSSLFDLKKHLIPTLSQFPSLSEWITNSNLRNKMKDPSCKLYVNSGGTMKSLDRGIIFKRTTSVKNNLSPGKRKDSSLASPLNEKHDIGQGGCKKVKSLNFNSVLGNKYFERTQNSQKVIKQQREPVNLKEMYCKKNGQFQKQGKSKHQNQTQKCASINVDEDDSDSSMGDTEFVNLLRAVFKEDLSEEDLDSSEGPSYFDDHQYGRKKQVRYQNRSESQSSLLDSEEATGTEELLDEARNVSSPLKRMLHFFQTHSVVDRPRGLYKCSSCQSAFSSDTQLLDHFHLHFCHMCGSTFEQKASLPFHLSQHKSGHQTRQSCTTKFDSMFVKDMFQKYTVISNSGKTFTCNMCQKHSSQRSSLFVHMYSHAQNVDSPPIQDSIMQSLPANCDSVNTRERLFPCTKCDKSFFSMSNLRGHMETHDETHKYLCSECGKGFRRRRALLKHTEIHSPRGSDTQLKVSKTKRRSSSKRSEIKDVPPPEYKKQLTSSSGQFVVAACFTPQKLVPDQRSVDTRERTFACPNCDKLFFSKRNLRGHMQTHTPKRFFCSFCNRGFRRRLTMERHKSTH